ncbi:AAA family ATPase [Microbacterium murale]|uniref:AAA domain-containing protein n=1 Tax=Microbacterium murale TaxID=1081040 RepID=A0ABQ1RUD6_9MICO|nr:AAA family ATPase [Microbacterium murale]GGD83177.1 hypothetical protein GCM10007269_27520 [Microbacterium murale]
MNQRQLLLTPASHFKTERQRWLSQDRVPLGTPTLFGGRGGEGKSTFALHVGAQATRGTLEGDMKGTPKSVLIISHEDDWGMVMKPRLIAAGADLDRVFQVAVRWQEDEITGESTPTLPLDLTIIRQAIEETDAGLLIIDPLASTMGGDHYKVIDVRRALDPLAQLAQEMGIGVIGIMHFNKGVGNASDKLSGSHAFRDAVRSVLLFATDEETGRRIVSVDKSNYSKAKGQSFAFNLVSTPVATDDGEIAELARVEELGESDISVSDIINRMPSETEGDGEDAESWLKSFMAESGGTAAAKQIMNAALADGFAKATIQRAGKKLCDKSSGGFQGSWTWTLRQGSHQGSQGSHLSERENYENDGENYEASYLESRPAIVERADMLCVVCSDPVGTIHLGYCDSGDLAHANARADAAAVIA